MLNRLKLVWIFYFPFFLFSCLLNIFFCISGVFLEVALLTKMMLLALYIYWKNYDSKNTYFIFYQNCGLSKRHLFFSILLFEFVSTVIIYKIILEFL
ncbi:hypothetical protein DNG35_01140 [Mesonia sp. K7]|nr:hypothetical protein DNG35_01140 [Mesonia sp. K7]